MKGNISAPSIEDSVALILWYRAGGKNAIYTVDARYTLSLKEAKHFISPALKNRVKLDCDNGQFPLFNSSSLNRLNKMRLNRTKRSTNQSNKLTSNKITNRMTNKLITKMSKKSNSKSMISDLIKPQIEKRCILRIKPVQQEDGQVDYRCRVGEYSESNDLIQRN